MGDLRDKDGSTGAPRRWRLAATAAGVVTGLGLLWFIVFAAAATRDRPTSPPRADGIVVLTGGGQRIEEGARLLAQGHGRRLLISGVNRRSSRDDVFRLTGLDANRFSCCVDLGYAALDTVGNAEETLDWATRHGFSSLVVVTASYHMPRSLLELARFLPGIELYPYPVLPKGWHAAPWYLSPGVTRVLVGEFLKYVPAVTRSTLAKASSRSPAKSAPARRCSAACCSTASTSSG
jgi:uncharacterized SAM-binding protein YcdF (DUF218 family)